MSKLYNAATIDRDPVDLYEEKRVVQMERDTLVETLEEISGIIAGAETVENPNWEKVVYMVKEICNETLKILKPIKEKRPEESSLPFQ